MTHRARSFPTWVHLSLVALLIGCGRGRPTRHAPIDDGPRIVSLSPGISITLGELGLAERLVGRHGWDRSVDQGLPVVGDQSGIDYEALARTQPTHILMEESADGAPALLSTLADKRGWRVIRLPLLALDDITAAVRTLAAEFSDQPGVADAASRLLARAESAWRESPGLASRAGRTLVVYWTSPIGVAGPGSFHHDLLLRLGVTAVPEVGGPFQTLDAEDMIAAAPDSLILLTPELDDAGVEKVIARWRGYGVPAARRGRVAVLRDWRYLTPSPAILALADDLRRIAHGWPALESADR